MEENEAAADADPAARPPATEPADGEPPSPPEAELNTNESLLAEHGTEDDAPASDAPGTDERDDGAESAAMALIAGEQASARQRMPTGLGGPGSPPALSVDDRCALLSPPKFIVAGGHRDAVFSKVVGKLMLYDKSIHQCEDGVNNITTYSGYAPIPNDLSEGGAVEVRMRARDGKNSFFLRHLCVRVKMPSSKHARADAHFHVLLTLELEKLDEREKPESDQVRRRVFPSRASHLRRASCNPSRPSASKRRRRARRDLLRSSSTSRRGRTPSFLRAAIPSRHPCRLRCWGRASSTRLPP